MRSLLLVVLVIAINSFSYAQLKKYRFCKENIIVNKDYFTVSTFSINHEQLPDDIDLLKSNLYVKNSTYAFTTNAKKTEYQISQAHFEDFNLPLKKIIFSLNFISTIDTGFRNTVNTKPERL